MGKPSRLLMARNQLIKKDETLTDIGQNIKI